MSSAAYKANLAIIDWSDFKPRERRRSVAPARSNFPMPLVVGAFSDPVQSMSDGKFYDNPRELEASYKAANNPQGIDYVCVGNDTSNLTSYERPTVNRAERRADIERAIEDVNNNRIPDLLTQAPV